MEDFDPAAAALAVTEELRPLGTPERAAQEKRYLRSDLEFFRVTVPAIRRVVKNAACRYPALDARAMIAWAVALWLAPVHERRAAAVEVVTLAAPRLAGPDLVTVERLVRESLTWAYVDTLAGSVAGEIALRDPVGAWPRIDAWAVHVAAVGLMGGPAEIAKRKEEPTEALRGQRLARESRALALE